MATKATKTTPKKTDNKTKTSVSSKPSKAPVAKSKSKQPTKSASKQEVTPKSKTTPKPKTTTKQKAKVSQSDKSKATPKDAPQPTKATNTKKKTTSSKTKATPKGEPTNKPKAVKKPVQDVKSAVKSKAKKPKTYPFADLAMNFLPRTEGEVRVYELPKDFPAEETQQRFKVVNQDMQVVGRATVNRRKKQITVIFSDFYKKWDGPVKGK